MSIVMYDNVNVSLIPADATAVAGYIDGRFANLTAMRKRFPHAQVLEIAISARTDGDCLDIETGDASPSQAPGWVKRQLARAATRPVCYANRSTMPLVIAALRTAGVQRTQVRLWAADYTFKPHRNVFVWGVLPTVADATQWTNKSHGKSLDESLCADDFFTVPAKPADVGKLRRWRTRLRHVQALLRDSGVNGATRATLAAYALQLRALIKRG